MHDFLVVVSGLMSIACVANHGISRHLPLLTAVTCVRQQGDPFAEQPEEQQPAPRPLRWFEWSDKFAERGRTDEERALRRYIVKLTGIRNLGAIEYLPEREERLFAERERAISILLEMLDLLPREAVFGDRSRVDIPIEDLERLARRDPSAFRAEHLELIHKIISANKYFNDPLLSVVAILRRKESIPHLVPLLDQPKGRSHRCTLYALEEIAHPDAIPHLRAYAERNPATAKAHWATAVIERIQIDNLPLSERVQKWEVIASELASEEAFKPEKVQATWDQARWVLSRLSEYGEWRHAEIILKLQAAARQTGDGSVMTKAEAAYQALAEKLPVQQKLELWEKILKEVSAQKMAEDKTALYRAVWAAERLGKEGGPTYLSLFEEMIRRERLFDAASLLEKAVVGAYQALAEKLPVQQKLELWEKILKEVSDQKIEKNITELFRAVWAVERLEKEGGTKYLGLFEEMTRRKGLFEGELGSSLRNAVAQAIARLKQDGR